MSNADDVDGVEEPSICAGCGVLVQANRPSCGSCGHEHAAPWPRALPQPERGYWVAVRASFTCNACRFESPLNHFELDEGVQCTRCGLEQRYEQSAWRELVDFAHRVGDFGSGGREGRLPDAEVKIAPPNMFPGLGKSCSWVEEGRHRASPGNPLCKSCKAPLVVTSSGKVLEVTCSSCKERRRYERPPTAQRIKQLAGVLADEHEEGSREVVLDEASGVVVLSCPACAAPLDSVDDSDGVIVCAYCRAVCRISTRSHARAGHKGTPEKTWWLYFDSPSRERHKRLNQARQAMARSEKQRRHEEERARRVAEQRQAPAPRAPVPREASPKAKAKQAEKKALMPLLFVMLMAPVVGGVIWYQHSAKISAASSAKKGGTSSEVLKRFSFDMPPGEVAKLLGIDEGAFMETKLDGAGLLSHVKITRGSSPSYTISVQGGDKLDLAAVQSRIAKLAPHRFRKSGSTHEININKSLLRFDPRIRGKLDVMTWLPDERAKVMADALWALARYAVFGSPEPTAAELASINGPPLKTVAGVDVRVPIEKAKDTVTAALAYASCQSMNDLMTKKSQMVCKVDVDDALVKEVALAWSNSANASIEAVAFVMHRPEGGAAAPGTMGACLDAALGAGRDEVIDHATGAKKRTWPLEAGNEVSLESYGVSVAAKDPRDAAVVPAWTSRFADIVKALDDCGR